MGGCCCASKSTGLDLSPDYFHYPASEGTDPLSSQPATVSTGSTGLVVNTNLDLSVPDTYQAPPAPLPFATLLGSPYIIPNRENSESKSGMATLLTVTTNTRLAGDTNSSNTLEAMFKNLKSDDNKIAALNGEDENLEELKKSDEPFVPPLRDEEDVCPTCLEEYDFENPKIITKCDHHFHLACILEWMERSDTCPVCDQEMVFSPAKG